MAGMTGAQKRTSTAARVAVAGVVVVALAVAGMIPASAAATTAPYDDDFASTACDFAGPCTAEAQSSTGRMQAAATFARPALSAESGSASAQAGIAEFFKPDAKARSVTVTATVRVDAAQAQLQNAVHNGQNRARVLLAGDLLVNCSGCPNGESDSFVAFNLVDTDPITAAPPSLAGVVRTLTATVTLAAGERFHSNSAMHVYIASQAALGLELSTGERVATASGALTLLRLDIS